jgi:hypothetical protein
MVNKIKLNSYLWYRYNKLDMNKINNAILCKNIFPYLTYNELMEMRTCNKPLNNIIKFYDIDYVRTYSDKHVESCTITQKSLFKFICKTSTRKKNICYNNINIPD